MQEACIEGERDPFDDLEAVALRMQGIDEGVHLAHGCLAREQNRGEEQERAAAAVRAGSEAPLIALQAVVHNILPAELTALSALRIEENRRFRYLSA